MNNCTFIGRLVADPDLTYISSGQALGKFTLALNERWNTGGDTKERTDFLDFTVWGKQAENLPNLAKKGSRLAVNAKARRESWEDKETNERRHKISFNVMNYEVIDFSGNGNSKKNDEPKSSGDTTAPFDTTDDDLEF